MESKIQMIYIQANIKKHVACSYDYKSVCTDNKFSKPFKSYLSENVVYNFINSMIEKIKYCTDSMKKYFNKELVMTIMLLLIVIRESCHITGKYTGSARRDCNIKVKLNHKIQVIFYNLKNYDSHLIMQELSKFNFKINVIPNGLEKYMSFNINNKLNLIDSFRFLSSS